MKRAKRKSAKKTVGRKKGAKKAASKKKAVKKKAAKKGAKAKRKLVIVVLDPGHPLGAKKSYLNRKAGDRIRWKNLDTIDHKIRFVAGMWPFTGVQHDILAKAKHSSETMTVRPNAPTGPYDYDVIPAIMYGPGVPPDGPSVVVGGE